MRPGHALSQAAGLAATASAAAARYGGTRLRAARRARELRRAGGFEYAESLQAGLLDPSITLEEAARVVSEHEVTALLDRLNHVALAAQTADKIIFYRYFSALGLPVPELYGAVGRAGGWSARSGRPLSGVEATAAFLAQDPPNEFVVKPSAGHHGFGVRLLRRAGAGFEDLEHGPVGPRALASQLIGDPVFDLHVVQERMRNHPGLQDIFPAEALQTIRLTTWVSASGSIGVLHGFVKLAVGGGVIDNFRDGSTGNVHVEVDVDSGAIGRPDAGWPAGVEGRVLPDWREACALVREASEHLIPQRSMGWDVALSTRGPVIVEANRGYDPFPSPRFGEMVRTMAATAGAGA